jgi:hypothetical protein
MSDDTVTDLLERLSSGRVDAAWSEFLARYSPLIKHVIQRHYADDDHATECFIHVCGALSDDRFAVSASRAASRDAGTALDTGGSSDPAPLFGQRCGFAPGLLADRKERTGSEERIELSRPSSNGRRSQLGGLVPGQRAM